MKRVCTHCHLVSDDLNLWCQEKHCPAENASEIFDNGEWFGPIQIIEPLIVLRSAVIYHAQRDNQPVLLKIANSGCEEKLRREAKTYLQLARSGQHPLLPVLLSAHLHGRVGDFPYGWTVIRGKPHYYLVFANVEGEILQSLLLKNPQPWYQHAGWIALSVADVIHYLHKSGNLHLCLNPEIILVRFDGKGIPRPMLLDLGMGDNRADIHQIWNNQYNLPAYTAPEILNNRETIGAGADVYGLGLILYEMLAGRPAFSYHLKRDERVIEEVLAGGAMPTQRADLKNIPQLAEQSILRKPGDRPSSVATFAKYLSASLPPIPAEQRKFTMNWNLFFVIMGAALAISLLALLAFSSAA